MLHSSPQINSVSLGALDAKHTALFVCDIQEKFRDVMLNFPSLIANSKKLITGCSLLGVPIVVTEQYPKGLGTTVAELDLASVNVSLKAEKTQFNMLTPELEEVMASKLCKESLASVVLCGIETHVCVEQTAAQLLLRGLTVHVVVDCCTSRTAHDRGFAIQRLSQMGCIVTTYENVLFKLLGGKDHPKFKEVSQIVRQPSVDIGLVSSL